MLAAVMCGAAAAPSPALAQTPTTLTSHLEVGVIGDGDTTQPLAESGDISFTEAVRTPGLHVGLAMPVAARLGLRIEAQGPAWHTYDYPWRLLDCATDTCVDRVVNRRSAGRTLSVSGMLAFHGQEMRRVRLAALVGLGVVQRQSNVWNTPIGATRSAAPTLAVRETTAALSIGAEAAVRVTARLDMVVQVRQHVPFAFGGEGLALSSGRILRPGVNARWRF